MISSDRVMPGSGAWPRLLSPGISRTQAPPASPGGLFQRSTTLPAIKKGMKCLNGVFCTLEQPESPGPGRRDAAASAPLPDPRFPQRQLLLAPEIQGHILGVVHQRLRREPVRAQGPGQPRPALSAHRPYLLHPGRGSRARRWPREKGPGSGPARLERGCPSPQPEGAAPRRPPPERPGDTCSSLQLLSGAACGRLPPRAGARAAGRALAA